MACGVIADHPLHAPKHRLLLALAKEPVREAEYSANSTGHLAEHARFARFSGFGRLVPAAILGFDFGRGSTFLEPRRGEGRVGRGAIFR